MAANDVPYVYNWARVHAQDEQGEWEEEPFYISSGQDLMATYDMGRLALEAGRPAYAVESHSDGVTVAYETVHASGEIHTVLNPHLADKSCPLHGPYRYQVGRRGAEIIHGICDECLNTDEDGREREAIVSEASAPTPSDDEWPF